MLGELRQRLADRDVTLHLATVRGPVRDLLTRAGVWQRMRADGEVHADVTAALRASGFEPRTATAAAPGPDAPRARQEVV